MAINRSKQKKLGNTNAVATKVGWVDPDTGELLVSIRGLPNAYDWDRKTNTFSKGSKKVDLRKKKEPVEKKDDKKPETSIKDQKVVKEFVDAADPVEGKKLKAEKTKKATKKPRKKKE